MREGLLLPHGPGPGQDWDRLTGPAAESPVSQGVPRATLGRAVGGGASVNTGRPVTTSAGPAPALPAGGAPSVSEVSQGAGWRGVGGVAGMQASLVTLAVSRHCPTCSLPGRLLRTGLWPRL